MCTCNIVTASPLLLHQPPSASGEYPVILFAVSVASAHVVTLGRDYDLNDPSQRQGFSKFYSSNPTVSKALMPSRDAHFVPVKYCGKVHCVTGKQLKYDTDYQAVTEGADASEAPTYLRAIRACLTLCFLVCSGARAGRAVAPAGATGCSCVATTLVPQAFPDYWELCVSWASRSMQPLPPPWAVTCSVKSSSSCDLSRRKGQAGANEGDAGVRFMDNGGPASQAAFTSARKARRMSSRRGGHAELRLEGVEHELDRCARELQGSWELKRPAYPILLMTV